MFLTMLISRVFFFQAEDGIRDVAVTGVQTCALPIWAYISSFKDESIKLNQLIFKRDSVELTAQLLAKDRSEERRVGKEWRSRWSP